MIKMPLKNKPPSDDISNYQFMLAGGKKVGKTSFCAQFPNHIILEFETGNAKHLNCRYIDIPNYKTAIEVITYLENNPTYADTIVVDGVQPLYELFVEQVTEDLKINDPSEKAHGMAWGNIRRHFGLYLRRIQALGKLVIYTAHTETKFVTNINNVQVSKESTDLGKAAHELMERYTHFWGVMCYRKGGSRNILIGGDEDISAGSGFENHFKKCGRTIPMGNSAKEAYDNFMAAWHNKDFSSSKKGIKLGK